MMIPYSPWAVPFWEGVNSRQFLLPWCQSCGQTHFPPRRFCPHCWAEGYDWRPIDGRGHIYSFSEVRAYAPSAFTARLPFVVAIIRLAEGVQVLSNVLADGRELAPDQPVVLDFQVVETTTLPCFRPAMGD